MTGELPEALLLLLEPIFMLLWGRMDWQNGWSVRAILLSEGVTHY